MSFNDNELLYMIHQKDELALGCFITKYLKLAESVISKVVYDKRVYRSAHDDLYQTSLIVLNDCVDAFNSLKATKFSTFYVLCLERKIRTLVQDLYRKAGYGGISISLDWTIDEFGEYTLGESIESVDYQIRGDYMFNYKQLENLVNETLSNESPLEQNIFKLKLDGYSYQEIANILGCPKKKVDNCLQKLKRKLLTHIGEYDRVIK